SLDEVDDVDGSCLFECRRLEVFLCDDDEAALLVFVAFDEVFPGHQVTVANADSLEADRRVVLCMQHAEPRSVIPHRGVQLDRNTHETEGYRTLPERSRHTGFLTSYFLLLSSQVPFGLEPVLEVRSVLSAAFEVSLVRATPNIVLRGLVGGRVGRR